ncbi:MAG: sulfatase-like hydrolase/transferase [Candidatus Promineifilaceae bacterium]
MTQKNILFIMCDQLRWDYLSCYGHPHLHTPNIDKLAERGVRFDRAYVQSPICAPSRASYYTGRYMSSHGVSVNFAALRPDELGIGDYLAPLGVRTALVGKTHSFPDLEGMKRLGIDPKSKLGEHLDNIGFEPYLRDDGLHPEDKRAENVEYNRYLRSKGYEGVNPWQTHANGALDEEGKWVNGWFLNAGTLPADIDDKHAETPYTTRRAIDFIEEAGDQPWCVHLSYIKPHWPYIAPEPYASMYGVDDFLPINRSEGELDDAHPVFKAYTQSQPSRGFQNMDARLAVLQAYMGLIKQIDDNVGEMMAFLKARGQLDNTVVVFTSDHGDYLGDHWMGEKSFFHEEAVRVPMIIADPSPEADVTRGTVDTRFVEAIDLLPTFIELSGGEIPAHRLEGRSLLPLLYGQEVDWRTYAVSEVDFADRGSRFILGLPDDRCNSVMIRTERWKYVGFDSFRPILFDLENDPQETNDLGSHPDYATIRAEMQTHLVQWLMRRKTRITLTDNNIQSLVHGWNREKRGILIGFPDVEDLPEFLRDQYRSQ